MLKRPAKVSKKGRRKRLEGGWLKGLSKDDEVGSLVELVVQLKQTENDIVDLQNA